MIFLEKLLIIHMDFRQYCAINVIMQKNCLDLLKFLLNLLYILEGNPIHNSNNPSHLIHGILKHINIYLYTFLTQQQIHCMVYLDFVVLEYSSDSLSVFTNIHSENYSGEIKLKILVIKGTWLYTQLNLLVIMLIFIHFKLIGLWTEFRN